MLATGHKHVLWDWNGTLLDDLDLCLDVINRILVRHALPQLDRERYHEIFDFPVRCFYERLGFTLDDGAFERLSHEFISTYDSRRLEATLFDDVKDVLRAISATGCEQSILSAHRQTTLHEIVRHFDLYDHFTHIAGLDDIHAHSKIERGRTLVATLDVPPAQVLMIGDTLHDIEVATALGVDCIVVAAGHHPESRLRPHAPVLLPSISALRDHFALALT